MFPDFLLLQKISEFILKQIPAKADASVRDQLNAQKDTIIEEVFRERDFNRDGLLSEEEFTPSQEHDEL